MILPRDKYFKILKKDDLVLCRSMRKKIYGFEYDVFFAKVVNKNASDAEKDKKYFGVDDLSNICIQDLQTGICFYVDYTHIEYMTPEKATLFLLEK